MAGAGLACAPVGRPLTGIWGFPLSPFVDDRLDPGLLRSAVAHQVDGGVDVVCVGGAIAQGELLRADERALLLDVAAEAVGPRVPLVVAVRGEAAPAQAGAAAAAGAAGLLLLPEDGDPARVEALLLGLARAAPDLDVVLYHRPPLRLGVDELRRLADAAPSLAGLKDGHRDVRLHRQLRQALGARLLWASAWEDVAVPFWSLGVDAVCPFSAAYRPAYARRWLELLRTGDAVAAGALLEAHAYPMVDLRLSRPGIDIPVVQAAMAACGLEPGGSRRPAAVLTRAERETVHALVRRMDEALVASLAASA